MDSLAAVTPQRALTRNLLRRAIAFVAVAALGFAPVESAMAGGRSILPQGGSVAAGHAMIGAPSNNSLTVNQSSQNAVINWNSFSIGRPNTVTYHQPNPSSATLNRVTGNTPSSIAGRLNANGQIYLVNPNGVAITKTGVVNVGGGFVGSTLGTDDSDFMNGKRKFKGNGHSASVSNAGRITAGKGGFVALIGGTVSNSGTIRVPLGKVGLGSGESVTLDVNGDGFMQVAVPTASKAADGKGQVDVSGRVSAAGGTIELQAATVKQAIRNTVNVSGTLSARSLSGHSGSIVLGGGAVNVSGRLDVSAGRRAAHAASVKSAAAIRNVARAGRATAAARPAPANGGTIAITGANVAIANKASLRATSQGAKGGAISVTGDAVTIGSATLDASGATGGGSILIGGGPQGSGPLAHAQTVSIASGATLTANATQNGNGGQIVAWSDDSTTVAGTLSAQAAGLGNGGSIETSGHMLYVDGISVSASSPHGAAGVWLLDPYNLTVSGAATTATISGTDPITYAATTGDSIVTASILDTNLNAGTSVILQTSGGAGGSLGDINVTAPIAKTTGAAASLTLNAYGSIIVSAAISSTVGAMAVTLDANTGGAGGYVNIQAAVSTLGGALVIGGGANPLTGPAVGTTVQNSGVNLNAPLNAGGGNVTINGTGFSSSGDNTYGIQQFAPLATITTTGSGNITLSGTSGGPGNSDGGLLAGASITAGTGNISITGAVSAAATGSNNYGVNFVGGATTSTAGAGTITVVGAVGAVGGSGSNTDGVFVQSGATVTAVDGLISVTGQNNSAGTGGSNTGVFVTGAGSTISSTGAGGVTVLGFGGGGGGGGNNYGVTWNVANAIKSSGGGAISVTGTGGGSGGTGASNYGVNLQSALAGNGGAITITGTGGNSSGTTNYGINTAAAITNTGAGAITLSGTGGGTGAREIGYFSTKSTTAGTGDISITGLASATATGSGNTGISFSTGTISTSGAGTVTLAGTATGTGGGSDTYGVLVQGGGTVTAAAGLISVTGRNNSTGGGEGNTGVYVTGGSSTISSTGAGGVTVLGFGGGSGDGKNYGVNLSATNAVQSTSTGAISITGVGGSGENGNYGVYVHAPLSVTGAGLISIIGDGGGGSGSNNDYGVYATAAITGGGGVISITGTPRNSSGDNYGISVTSVAAGAANIVLTTTGTATASGALTAAGLDLLGVGGAYTLTNASNAVTTLAGATGSATYSQTGALTIGTVNSTTGLATTGLPWITTGGALTIASGATVSGAAPVLAATGAFINASGSGAVVANSGLRWLIYSANSTGDAFGGLNSNNAAVWNTPANGAVTATGNRYVFANQPTVTFTSVSLGKVYGVDDTAAVAASYTATGFQSVANAYTDTLATVTTGAASVTSAGSVATATVAGSPYAITAATGTLTSTNGYALTFASPGMLTVTAAPLTVTADAQSRAYGAANPTLTYVATGLVNSDTLSGALATTATATSPVLGSPYAITQGTLGDPNYAITYVGANLTVTAAPLTVTASNQTKTYGNTFAFAGTEFTSTGLQNGETIGSVTLTSAGSAAAANVAGSPYAIVASAAAGGTFTASNYAIGYVDGAMTVTQAAATVTADAQSRAYGAANPTLTYVATGLVNSDTLSGALATTATATSPVLGSPYAITQGTLGDPNYAITYVGANLTVTAAPLTVTASNQTKTYGNTFAFAGTEFTSTGLQNGETIGSVALTSAGSAAAANVAGSPYAIVASAAAGGTFTASNYAIGYVDGAMTVTQAAATVTADAQSRAYGAANPTLTYVATGLVNSDTLSGALATTATATSPVLGSPYAITQGTLGDPNYAITYVGANLTVTAAPLTVTASNQTKTYGNTFAFAGTEFTSTGLQNGETIGSVALTSAGSAAAANVAGSPYAIVASAAAGGTFTASNYAIGYVDGAMTVTQAAATVTADAQSRAYGAANPTLTYVATGLVNSDTLSGALATTATATSPVLGSPYAITQGTLGDPNYAITYVGANLTVTAAPLTVTASNQTKTYGNTFAFAGTEFTSTGLQNGETIGSVALTSAGSAAAANVAGSPYAIVASAAAGGTFTASNYAIGYVDGAMTVTQAAATVTADAQSRAYGAANPTLTYVATGLVNSDTLSGALATTATATSPVLGSPYAITQGTLGDPNYAITYVGANLTVTAAPLTVTASNQTKTYGNTFAFAGTEFTSTGLQNGETIGSVTLTSAGSAAAANVAGSPYAIVASAAAGGTFTASNYAIGYVDGAMTVTQAAATVTADAQSRAYGAANPTLTYVATGLVNSDTLSGALATTATATSPVLGSPYAITQGTLGDPNYAITYVGANLTVTAAPLTVTASNQTKTYGNTFAFAGTEFTSTGLQNGETIGSVTLTSAGSAAAANVAGSPYAIVASAAAGGTFTASNYAIGYVDGAMTVTQAAATVTADAQSRAYGAANPTLTYVATGLVNSDTLSGALATTATATSPVLGSPYAITQGTLGDPNYAITYVGANLTVTAAPLTVTANNQTKTYGNTFAFAGTEFTSTGLQNGETIGSVTLTSAGSAAAANVAGSPYAIVASAAAGGTFTASNYAIGYVDGAMTVTQAAATVTADAQSRAYGAANPTLTYVATGLVNSDTLSGALATTATATSPVLGSPYAITQGTLGDPNYAITYVGANLTVTAAPLTVTASNQTKTYGNTFAFAGTEFTSTGLQNGETIGSVTLTSAGSAAAANVAGSPYAIVASAAAGGTFTASNYAIGYVDGAMTVTQAAAPVPPNPNPPDNGAVTSESRVFPSYFSTIDVSNNGVPNVRTGHRSSACSSVEVSRRLHRYGHVELTGEGGGSCKNIVQE